MASAAAAGAEEMEKTCPTKAPATARTGAALLTKDSTRSKRKDSLATSDDMQGRAKGNPSKSWQNEVLAAHNLYRCMHGVPSMSWNTDIAKTAQDWADETRGAMQHSPKSRRSNIGGHGYLGENLAMGRMGAGAVKMWYDEIDRTNPRGIVKSFSGGTGHYTQVVWKASLDLGCGQYERTTVCMYGPGGNMRNGFQANVLAPTKTEAECRKANPPVPSPPTPPPPAARTPTPSPPAPPPPLPALGGEGGGGAAPLGEGGAALGGGGGVPLGEGGAPLGGGEAALGGGGAALGEGGAALGEEQEKESFTETTEKESIEPPQAEGVGEDVVEVVEVVEHSAGGGGAEGVVDEFQRCLGICRSFCRGEQQSWLAAPFQSAAIFAQQMGSCAENDERTRQHAENVS
eukprot:CAMPEP_0172927918 /NCGR_PEP_ID=MMETSP1075-20121228/217714_1 /TAXON_ID=2916 /ORGANISM="Ceratium fusus, Strain PA161109" /LENGTH=401 /DNA_ID=CAMNT_0013789195 /DNA_START=119 /DNA_END=1321 /DNA_ORIENTATION=-